MAKSQQALLKYCDSNDNSDCTKRSQTAKDGFYSWIVCVCAFFVRLCIIGVLHSFGSFFVEFTTEFQASKAAAGKISMG